MNIPKYPEPSRNIPKHPETSRTSVWQMPGNVCRRWALHDFEKGIEFETWTNVKKNQHVKMPVTNVNKRKSMHKKNGKANIPKHPDGTAWVHMLKCELRAFWA